MTVGRKFMTGAAVVFGFLGGSNAALDAQTQTLPTFSTRSHLGLGYVINAPRMFVGFNVLAVKAGGFGLYADFKLSHDSPGGDEFCCPFTLEEALGFGDQLFAEKSAWRSFNAAIVRVIGPQLALYAGGGISNETAYRQYFDRDQERGDVGTYWVEAPGESGDRFNVLGGLIFQGSRNVLFVFGGEREPLGVSVGVTLAVPR